MKIKIMLRDEIIYLRRLESTDLDLTWKWINTPEIFLTMGVNAPVSKSAQQRWFENLDKSNDKIVFAICLHEKKLHVGNISLDSIDWRHRNARLAIFIADKSYHRKGIGSRAVNLALEYAFNYYNLHRIYLKIDAERERELFDFYGRFGFRKEGYLVEHEFKNGKYIDKILYGIIKNEW